MFRHLFPILMGTACSLTLRAQDAQPNTFQARQIPLITTGTGNFLLCKATVEGKEVNLLVDSGAQLEIAMTKKWATDHGKELTAAGSAAGIAGKAEMFTTKLGDLSIGKALTLRNLTVRVMDLTLNIPFTQQADGTVPVVDGLIGCAFLMKSQSVVSYQDNRLYVPAQGNRAGAYLAESMAAGDRILPMVKSANGAPCISLRFGEKDFLFIVDSAAGGNVMLPEVAKEIGLKTTKSADQISGAGGTAQGGEVGIAENVLIGGAVKLPKFDFRVTPTPSPGDLPNGVRYGGILGNGFLSQLKVRMDFATYHMIFTPAGEAASGPAAEDGKKVISIGEGQDPEEAIAPVIQQHFNEVPLVRSTAGYYFVEARINDKPRWMCLDSGADTILIDNAIAKEDGIELTPGPTATGIDGKDMQASNGKLKSFSIGPNAFEAPTTIFTDLSHFSQMKLADGTTKPSAGLVGLSYFRSLPVAVDFPKSRLLVAKGKIQGGLTGLKAQIGTPVAPMLEDEKGRHYLVAEVAGRKVLFLVDIGTSSCVLFDKAAENLKIDTYPMQGTVNTLGEKNMTRKGARINGLKLGRHELAGEIELIVLPSPIETVSDMPVIGMAGSMLFEALKSIVDFDTNEITLTSSLVK